MLHRVERAGLAAEYPIAFTIGSGNVGHSFAVRIGEAFFQSPASWFSQSKRWDMSPGFEHDAAPDFDRRIQPECLNCHSNGVRGDTEEPQPISCERCHEKRGKHFANPAKLPVQERDVICESCHLQGEARILDPGSTWTSQHPTYSTYVTSQPAGRLAVVSQVEQFALSRCLQGSGGRLWCATCHDPHGEKKDVRKVCASCHSATLSAAHRTRSDECASCHMPRRPTPEVAHTVYTDHRIRRKPEGATEMVGPAELRAWREPPSQYRDRNLGLAYVYAGERNQSAEWVQKGFALLLPAKSKDPEVLAALGSVLLRKNRPQEARAMFAEAARAEPASAAQAHNLAVAELACGDAASAISSLERAVAIDPVYERSWLLLARIYQNSGQAALRTSVIKRYLEHVPQSLTFRAALRR